MGNQFQFQEIDVYEDPHAATRYNIQATPTFIVLAPDGSFRESFAGLPSKSALKSALEGE